MPLLRTTGVNVAPVGINTAADDGSVASAFEPLAQASEFETSSLHLALTASALYNGQPVNLNSEVTACGSQCRKSHSVSPEVAVSLAAGGVVSESVEILRFAKHGFAPLAPAGPMRLAVGLANVTRRAKSLLADEPYQPIGAQWLVHMEDGFVMAGEVTRSSQTAMKLRMGGRMILTLQPDGASAPHRLRSRKEPIFETQIHHWPPRGSILELANPPIEYFDEGQVDLPDAKPVIVITANQIAFGQDPVTLLEVEPKVTRLAHVTSPNSGQHAVLIEWEDVSGQVRASGDPPVEAYNVYRLFADDSHNGWILARTVPASVLRWIDEGNDGSRETTYLVLAAARYPFGYLYESGVQNATRILPRAR
ncbi:MAG: hypothetical protein K5880_10485 [Hydrogenophaga sp.]|uniref:hypothetical protein n=1 Tax=Hydrogenophaga sp. TaxID=1904254 RepID=UPI00261BA52C|nr:hypothetical protein [Hydrogenophaga sp.]MCV0439050.1 hypothetical protein [Hydrogenophaga sp.]